MSIETREMHTTNKIEPAKVNMEHKDGKVTEHLCDCCKSHNEIKMSMIRGSGYELRNVLPKWFQGLNARELISHEQSESEGNVTITIFYR